MSVLERIAHTAADQAHGMAVGSWLRSLTYTELWRRAQVVARGLDAAGVGMESFVALWARPDVPGTQQTRMADEDAPRRPP